MGGRVLRDSVPYRVHDFVANRYGTMDTTPFVSDTTALTLIDATINTMINNSATSAIQNNGKDR